MKNITTTPDQLYKPVAGSTTPSPTENNRDFYITRKARDEFQFPDSFYALRGNVVIPNYQAAQSLAALINQKKSEKHLSQEQFVQPAQLNAMGLLHEVFHIVLQAYREDVNRDAFEQCDKYLTSHLGADAVNNFLKHLADIFPSLSVYRGQQTIEQFFNTATDGIPNRQILLEEIILLHLQHHNPALQTMSDLIEEKEFFESEQYNTVINLVEQFFDEQPAFSPEEQPLLKMLFSSIHSSPNSLSDQLFFIQSHWKKYIERFRQEFFILQALDFLKEEGKYFLMQKHIAAQAQMERSIVPSIEFPFFHGFGGEKESPPVPVFPTGGEPEPEQFSPDINWMPRLVLIAKNAFVWLNQLSKQYSRSITRLDEIPDDELSRLSSYGITGLWLIGIWNRSKASKRIKHLHGNIDAEASAYSLDGYDISEELGGYSAYYNLRERARAKGIRLACDMVPNHMGIDSQWVINHPDWFIQTEAPPYFNYSFTGPDLSNNDRVGIYIEDGYWRRSDAAVVFKRHDRYTGDVKYIYHGNDGTNMPWNDTAQLDFMKPEVREAVIQTILHVARLFPVIRFDAAMTLAKKHYQRLWFPQPGTAGAVPSRAMFAMTKEQFDAQMPIEFWREVVDRVQQEVPDTLLLAEAFWLMEGYFVRTLGMHRVYNSAFMHMLKKEENTNFKQTIKNVLEYNPQILKRHVNFMSNPDEETAIAQFGSHDKYFGVCVMMITLPGLPMFGHGQLEGFTEKYGMEYRRAYYDEAPNYHLLYRHEQEIFQLLKKRYLFAEVENFQMYDFYNEDGVLNDDVFAYSNRYGNERALIVYNNAYERATGRIHPASAKQMLGERLIESTIGAALQLSPSLDSYYIFKDRISNLEYLHPTREIHQEGIRVSLDGYKYHVFLEMREDFITLEKPYDILVERLDGRGVFSIEEELAHIRLEPLHNLIRGLMTESTLATLHYGKKKRKTSVKALRLLEKSFNEMLDVARSFDRKFTEKENHLERLQSSYSALLELTSAEKPLAKTTLNRDWKALVQQHIASAKEEEHTGWHIAICWMSLQHISRLRERPTDIINDWKLERVISQTFLQLGASYRDFELVKLLLVFSTGKGEEKSFIQRLLSLLNLPLAEQFIGINQWQDELYISKEQFEELLDWVTIVEAVGIVSGNDSTMQDAGLNMQDAAEKLSLLFDECADIKKQAERAGYKFEELVSGLGNMIGGEGESEKTKE